MPMPLHYLKHGNKIFSSKTHFITKMSDMTRRDECNGQFKFKMKWLFIT